jgi:hypothetical protein
MHTKLLAVFLLAAFTLVSCKKDSTNPATTQQGQLAGTWNPQSATINGQPSTPAVALNWVQGAVSARLTINANNTFSYSEMDGANAVVYSNGGTYTISGNTVTLTYTTENGQPINPATASLTFAVAGNQLTTTSVEGGNTIVVVYARV